MDYMVGCNYLASHAGTEMWARWDASVVEADFCALKQYGVRVLRVFPIWRDFQPIRLLRCGFGAPFEYRMPGDRKLNDPYELDADCVAHFHEMCRLAQANGFGLMVSVVTGWLSGRLYVPPMLEGVEILSDAEALKWQHRYATALVREMKSEPAIIAWDLGNESNNMSEVQTRAQAYVWTMTVSGAIRAADPSRPVISGMHALKPNACWTFEDQGELTDILTPHPYPSIFSGQDTEPLCELKTTMYPTAQALYYAGLGGKPAMIQETGTFNDMLGDESDVAAYANTSLFSGWANDSLGWLWWCAHDQRALDFPPYDWNMCENELGLLHMDRSPKKIALAMRRFSEMLERLPFERLPTRQTDAVCVLTEGQNPLMVSLAVTTLTKQAGFETQFVYAGAPLPEAEIYLLPNLVGHRPLDKHTLDALVARVRRGATLYLSFDGGLITSFEEISGLKCRSRQSRTEPALARADGAVYSFAGGKSICAEASTARVLLTDQQGDVLFAENALGSGRVYTLIAPMEQMLAETPGAFYLPSAAPYYKLYQRFSADVRACKAVASENPFVGVTLHFFDETRCAVVAVNYSARPQEALLRVRAGWRVEVLFGDINAPIPGNDAWVLMARKA